MIISRHVDQKTERNRVIAEIGGIGTVIYTTTQYDEKRGKTYRYEITDNAILRVIATDMNMLITQMIARPSRIKKYWADAPHDLIMLAVKYTRKKYYI